MKLRHRLAQLNRLQHGLWFKIIASAVVVVLGISITATYVVNRAAELRAQHQAEAQAEAQWKAEEAKTPEAELLDKPPAQLTENERQIVEAIKANRTAAEATRKVVSDILATRSDPTAVAVGVTIATSVAVAVIWLGLGLTGLGLLALLAVISAPLYYLGVHEKSPFLRGMAEFIAAVGLLSFAFIVLMEVLRAVLSPPWPVCAIARNVVNEAVRMKVSLVFIILLVFGLAALPAVLDPTTPLRYRVQSFLQYSTSGTFSLIAVLAVFLAVGSVAFEQRDRIIWQTMTKPVASWQYLLGKWLGVVGVAAVLMTVSASGIFLFGEYLREQRALGEVTPFHVSADSPTGISEDRYILENQVLTARSAAGPVMPRFTDESLMAEIDRRAEQAKMTDPNFRNTIDERRKFAEDFLKQEKVKFLTLEAGAHREYQFTGLQDAKETGKPVTLRYRVDQGSNDPRATDRITFRFANTMPQVREVPLGQSLTLNVSPAAISPEGVLDVEVINGDIYRDEPNTHTIAFPPGGFEVFYPVGSYYANFFRVMVILWLKIAFLAMVGVAAATFLSFAVASLVAFGVFFLAETTNFLIKSLDMFGTTDALGKHVYYWKVAVQAVATPLSKVFEFYAKLRPTSDLVEGQVLGWGKVIMALLILGSLTTILYFTGVLIFRKRELATYSGQ